MLKKGFSTHGIKSEDLTAEERKVKRWQVQQLKQARRDGKRAFICLDGKLVIEWNVITPPALAEMKRAWDHNQHQKFNLKCFVECVDSH